MAHPSTTFRFLAEPTDVNFGGNVHGVCQWHTFHKPIKEGQLVEIIPIALIN
jgi:acyl-CoA hydrolase